MSTWMRVPFLHQIGALIHRADQPGLWRVALRRYTEGEASTWVQYGVIPKGAPGAHAVDWIAEADTWGASDVDTKTAHE